MKLLSGKDRKVKEAIVAISKNNYEGDAIKESLSLLDIDNIIDSKSAVMITPNWVENKKPESGVVVGAESLRELIRFIKSKNPQRIIIATGSASGTLDVMEKQGYKQIIEEEKVEFVDLNYGPFIKLELNHDSPGSTKLHEIVEEIDILISFTQIKVHSEATVSLAIKNIAMGWPPTEEHGAPKKNTGIHNDLHGFIRAMAEKIPIDISIVSGDQALVGKGPSGGKPVNSDLVIAGTDPVATDVVAARLLGFQPQAVNYLHQLINKGIGEGDLDKIDLRGLSLEEAGRIFSKAAYEYEINVK
ncbi:DUF362 domain-containing protein [Natronospora cellulosivora (SeqCode)]